MAWPMPDLHEDLAGRVEIEAQGTSSRSGPVGKIDTAGGHALVGLVHGRLGLQVKADVETLRIA